MKKILAGLMVTTLISAALIVGCSSPTPTSPGATATPTKTATPVITNSPTNTGTSTKTPTITSTPTITPTGTITPQVSATPQAAQSPVVLGTTSTYSVLAASSTTNTGATTLCGDLGLSPGTSFGAGYVFCNGGVLHITDTAAANAQGDLTTAYGDASGRLNPALVAGDLGGLTLYHGLYNYAGGGSLAITGDLTLDAQSNPNAVFIFQITGTLDTAVSSRVLLINGAKATNVFWQVSTSCSLGDYSIFAGTIMTGTATTVGTGVVVDGRALAKSAVTMQGDNIAVPAP